MSRLRNYARPNGSYQPLPYPRLPPLSRQPYSREIFRWRAGEGCGGGCAKPLDIELGARLRQGRRGATRGREGEGFGASRTLGGGRGEGVPRRGARRIPSLSEYENPAVGPGM